METFAHEWPEGADVSLDALQRACALKLDLGWVAQQFLSAPAFRAYEETMAPAFRAYEETMAPARRAYLEAMATAPRAYLEARATALWSAWCIDYPSVTP